MNKRAASVNILLAEDDDAEYGMVERVFADSALSHRLVRFKDGRALLDFLLARASQEKRVIDKHLPCVILLDMNMPGMTGVETLRELKSHPALRKLPVIMLTSSAAQ